MGGRNQTEQVADFARNEWPTSPEYAVYTLKRIRLADRLAREGLVIQGSVKKITDNGRTIQYEYNTGSGLYQGKTMTLSMALVKKYKENDPVEVLFDPARHELSVLKLER